LRNILKLHKESDGDIVDFVARAIHTHYSSIIRPNYGTIEIKNDGVVVTLIGVNHKSGTVKFSVSKPNDSDVSIDNDVLNYLSEILNYTS